MDKMGFSYSLILFLIAFFVLVLGGGGRGDE